MRMKGITLVLIIVLFCCTVSLALATEVKPGQYKVGEDIPAGSYTITNETEKTAQFHVYKVAYKDYSNNGLLTSEVLVPKEGRYQIGKVTLEDGNVVDIEYQPLNFKKYNGISFEADKINTVWPGQYKVGEDIPAGSYTIINETDRTAQFHVYKAAYKDYSNNGLLTSEVLAPKKGSYQIGKVTLEDGNVVDIEYQKLTFQPYQGISFDSFGLDEEKDEAMPTEILEDGEIKAHFSDQGISCSTLFGKNATRAAASVMVIADLTDEVGGKGPLPFEPLKATIKYSSWIGITRDQANLIIVGYYDEKNSIIVLDYNPKGIIKYQVFRNIYSSDDEMIKALSSLYSNNNVKEYYEVTGEEKYETFEAIGVKKIRRLVER